MHSNRTYKDFKELKDNILETQWCLSSFEKEIIINNNDKFSNDK